MSPPDNMTVAYVMTHYPRVALSFIANEIDALQRLGMIVHPLAMNLPDAADLLSQEAQARQARTTYLKQSPARVAGALLRQFLRHPLRMNGLACRAIASARLDLALIARRLSHLAQAALAADHCRREGIRHLHAQFGLAPATIAWFAAEILNFPERGPRASWSFTIHGFHDFIDEANARLDLKAASAAFVVCVSDFTRSQLWRVSDPRHWSKAQVVRCGIDLTAFAFRQPKSPGSKPRILSVGRLSPEKGQLVLLQACRKLADTNIEFELAFVGGGPFEPSIRAEIERLGLTDSVHLLGERPAEEVRQLLDQSDVFCLSSFSEGLPISIMEAMAVGVPVVTTSIAGIPELAVHGETALTVPPANVDALAEALTGLLRDRELGKRLAEAARQRVERMHDLDTNASRLLELFRDQSPSRSEGAS
jgi:colanic acid/amylovoran biosynthesis glycosyltransferase